MTPQEELAALRRLAVLEAKAAGEAPSGHVPPRAKTGGETGRAHPAGTGTDDEKIKIVTHQYSPACPWLRG